MVQRGGVAGGCGARRGRTPAGSHQLVGGPGLLNPCARKDSSKPLAPQSEQISPEPPVVVAVKLQHAAVVHVCGVVGVEGKQGLRTQAGAESWEMANSELRGDVFDDMLLDLPPAQAAAARPAQ